MKLILKHTHVRSTDVLDTWVENQIISLQPSLHIDEANVCLAFDKEASPGYQVNVHLVTPGPDVFAEGRDHTLQAAFEKTLAALREKIDCRATRKQKRQQNHAPQLRER